MEEKRMSQARTLMSKGYISRKPERNETEDKKSLYPRTFLAEVS